MSSTTATTPSAVHSAHAEAHEMGEKVKRVRTPLYLNTRTFTSHIFFGPYMWLPLICAFSWLAALLTLLGIWVRNGKPRYEAKEPHVVFISDIAGKYKHVFIPLVCITSSFYVLTLLTERWLRHQDRLPSDVRRREVVLSWLSIVCATIGGTALILLAVFDTFSHKKVHWSMTAVFVVFVAFAAMFQSGQLWSLHKDHPDRPSLLRNSIAKLVVVVIAVLGAIAFGSLYGVCRGSTKANPHHTAAQCENITSGGAALEWTIAFLLFFYFLTLAADLWGAAKTSPRYIRRREEWRAQHRAQHDVEHAY